MTIGSRRPSRHRARQWGTLVLEAIESQPTSRLFGLWLLMIVACAAVYWLAAVAGFRSLLAGGEPLDQSLGGLTTALYFSFVTATSVGYGDVVPLGALRVIAIAEAVAGLLVFGAVIAKFVSRRQDELVREIHRTTFEERLDRVQTNLHLVLAELQTIAAMCDDGPVRVRRVAPRLESAALVFAGELRAIHDLLYHPYRAPEENVLGAILASLAGALRELGEVLTCLPADFSRSATLQDALAMLTHLARDICSECVPRAYAPALATWMDRIQETSRHIV